MNSKFVTIAAILVLIVVVFGVAYYRNVNTTTSVTNIESNPAPIVSTTTQPAPAAVQTTPVTASTTTTVKTKTTTAAPATPASSAVAITIKNYMFSPNPVTIKKGTTVTWTNADIAKHTVTSDNGTGPSSKFFGQGESYSYTFTDAGTYAYHCEPHPYMKATIVVTP